MTTPISKEERQERAEAYLRQSLEYLENASKAFADGDAEKSGEFLWGSVGTALKALAMAAKGLEIRAHHQFWDIAREVTRETADQSIYEAFRRANSLHSNFYESRLSLEDIKVDAKDIVELVKKLNQLTNRALTQEET